MRTLIWSEDGSPTLYSDTFGETYHSDAGAVEESMHVFLQAGLEHRLAHWFQSTDHPEKKCLYVVEYGFGTGLNVLLTLDRHIRLRAQGIPTPDLLFHTLEKYPLEEAEYGCLNFPKSEHLYHPELLQDLHRAPWNQLVELAPGFTLLKEEADFLEVTPEHFRQPIDVVYFDAFSPSSQPELWETPVFETLAHSAAPGCTLVTYSARGSVKQALRTSGFTVGRLHGYGRKRHMVRAIFEHAR